MALPQIVHYEERERIPALTDICISLVARYAEDMESLGDIGSVNMKKVNNIICKSRKMCVSLFPPIFAVHFADLDWSNTNG